MRHSLLVHLCTTCSKLSGGAVTLPTGNKEDIKNVHVQRERSIAYLSGKDLVSIDELEVDRQEQRVHKPKPVSKAPSRITRKDSRIAYRIAAQHEKEKADTAHKAQLGIVDEHSVLNDRQKLNKRLSQLGLTMISMADDGRLDSSAAHACIASKLGLCARCCPFACRVDRELPVSISLIRTV
eukprot:scaffold1554_cov401-Prasinococcus_capsulatus_cf.AAC.26